MSGVVASLLSASSASSPLAIPGTAVEIVDSPVEFTGRLIKIAKTATHLVFPVTDGGSPFSGSGYYIIQPNSGGLDTRQVNNDHVYQTMGVDKNGALQIFSWDTTTADDLVVHTAVGSTFTQSTALPVSGTGITRSSPAVFLYDAVGDRHLLFGHDSSFNIRLLHSANGNMSSYTAVTPSGPTGTTAPQMGVAFKNEIVLYRSGVLYTCDRSSSYAITTRYTPAAPGNFGKCMCVRSDVLLAWNRNGIARSTDGINWALLTPTVNTSFPVDDATEYVSVGIYDYLRMGSRIYRALADTVAFTELTGVWPVAGTSSPVDMLDLYPQLIAISREAGAGTKRFINFLA